MGAKGQGAATLYLANRQLTIERCRAVRSSLIKKLSHGGFMRRPGVSLHCHQSPAVREVVAAVSIIVVLAHIFDVKNKMAQRNKQAAQKRLDEISATYFKDREIYRRNRYALFGFFLVALYLHIDNWRFISVNPHLDEPTMAATVLSEYLVSTLA